MNNGDFLKSGLIRLAIISGWIFVIGAVLYFGNASHDTVGEDEPAVQGRVLRLLVWGDLFDKNYLRKFEEAMGVTVTISSYDSNEELIVKLKASGGRGYDLIAPSDYAVKMLQDEGLLRRLDRSRMPFFKNINPLLLGQAYDPENEVSLPYEWEVYGLAYNKEFFKTARPDRTWGMIFNNPQGAFRVVVSDDSLEMVRLAAHFLFGSVEDELTEEQMAEVEALLRREHSWVEAYTRTNLDYYLVAGYSPLAFASSAYVGRRKKLAHRVGFMLPREGGLITIENLAMPLYAENEDLIYAFLNFVMGPESMAHHFDLLTYFPSTLDVVEPATLDPEIRALRNMSAEEFKKLIFVKQIMPEDRMNHLWIAIKS